MSHVSEVRIDRSHYMTLFGGCSRPVETGPSESRQHGVLVIGESRFFLLQCIAGEEVVIEIIRENFSPIVWSGKRMLTMCLKFFCKNNKQTIKQKTNKQKKLNNEGESKGEVGQTKNQTQEEVEVNEVTREVIEAARFLLIK